MTELAAQPPLSSAATWSTGLELAGNLVSGLDRGRLHALGLAADLHNSHGLALSRDLAGVIGNACALARDLTDARELARIIYGDRDLVNAIGSPCARARDLANDLAYVRAADRATRGIPLDRALTVDRALASARTYADARDRARISARTLAEELAFARDSASALAEELAFARDFADAAGSETGERDDQARPARPAVRVAWTAAVLLPRRDRIRYDLEYWSELAELAADGAGRREQLRHAARLLVRAPLLRADLAGARRRQAVR